MLYSVEDADELKVACELWTRSWSQVIASSVIGNRPMAAGLGQVLGCNIYFI